jgi:hypothetical protein
MAGLVLDHPLGTALDLGVGIDQHLRDLARDRRTVGQLPSRGDVQLNPASPCARRAQCCEQHCQHKAHHKQGRTW